MTAHQFDKRAMGQLGGTAGDVFLLLQFPAVGRGDGLQAQVSKPSRAAANCAQAKSKKGQTGKPSYRRRSRGYMFTVR